MLLTGRFILLKTKEVNSSYKIEFIFDDNNNNKCKKKEEEEEIDQNVS
jgi:hypothetical protein